MIEKYLKNSKKIEYFDKITSTNTVLKERAEKGEIENTVLVSDFQTDGRGRLGKTFFSPKGCGIYFSYLIKPSMRADDAVFVTVAAAVAMRRAIKDVFSIGTKIKWVNDIYYENKKLCGILTEGKISKDGTLDYAVLGVGVNIKTPPEGYPDEFSYKTTNLEEITKQDTSDKKWKLVATFLNEFDIVFSDKNKSYIKEYKKESCLIGKEIEILSGEHQGFAKVIDIDDSARLLVDTGKEIISLASGDVSIRFS